MHVLILYYFFKGVFSKFLTSGQLFTVPPIKKQNAKSYKTNISVFDIKGVLGSFKFAAIVMNPETP